MAVAIPWIIAAIGAVSAVRSAEAQKKASDFNAKIKREQADAAITQAKEDERRVGVQSVSQLGSIKEGIAVSGLKAEGSAMDVLQMSAQNAETAAADVRTQGIRRANAYAAGATLDDMQGSAAMQAGYTTAATSLLGAGSKMYQAGAFDTNTDTQTATAGGSYKDYSREA